jgi:hypothetical protein
MIWTEELVEQARELVRDYTYSEAGTRMSSVVGEPVSGQQVRSALRRRTDGPVREPSRVIEWRDGRSGVDLPFKVGASDAFTTANLRVSLFPGAVKAPPQPVVREVSFAPPLSIKSRGALVIADLHAPFHNRQLLERALNTATAMGVRDVYIIGDLFDFTCLSSWPANEARTTVDQDIDAGGAVLEYIASFPTMQRVIITSGNHDERLAKRAGGNFLLRHLVDSAIARRRMGAEVIVTEYDYVFHNDAWVLGHLSSFSRRPGEVAKRIADRYQRNAAVGHDHIQGYTSTGNGKHIAISIGAMVHIPEGGTSPFWYKERRLNDYSPAVNGFLILDEDVPYLFTETGLSSLNGGLSWAAVENKLFPSA